LFRVTIVSSFVVFFVWFFIGNVLVLTIRNLVEFDHLKCMEHYCDEITFAFSLWSIIVYWLLYLVLILTIVFYYKLFIS
jgi:hypothetical protein